MALAWVHTRARHGVRAPEVRVEVFMAPGLPSLRLVGLGGPALRESADRVRAALAACGFELPGKRITINLAPADLPKEGARFDLAMAVGLLAAAGQVPLESLRDLELLGELSLGGALRAVDASLPAALAATAAGRRLVVPADVAGEAARAPSAVVLSARTLAQVVAHLRGECPLPRAVIASPSISDRERPHPARPPDLADVCGQALGRRALEIAAAGAHSLRFIGPPGCGKSLLARCLPGLLPGLSATEALELAVVRSLLRPAQADEEWPEARPFRAPTPGASAAALIGGGGNPRPGEISLALHGVLFLDELPEWPRSSLEALREPLESGLVRIARAHGHAEFPARTQLLAAMNPCPCGWAGDASGRCHCPDESIARYRARVSGPLLDRIDLHVSLQRLATAELRTGTAAESSASVRARVLAARERQQARQGMPNGQLEAAALVQHLSVDTAAEDLLLRTGERLALSARSLHRLLRVARTIADLAGDPILKASHLAEALAFRPPEPGAPAAAVHAAIASRATLPRMAEEELEAGHGVAGPH